LEIVGRIHLAQAGNSYHHLVNMVMNIWVPQNAGKFSTSWGTSSSSKRSLHNRV